MGDKGELRDISIHALREEGDILVRVNANYSLNFYPRPPRGGRPGFSQSTIRRRVFLSTPSARRATTDKEVEDIELTIISIHALREEGDSCAVLPMVVPLYFYPRPPRGGRQTYTEYMNLMNEFLSTPSARRATETAGDKTPAIFISIHALREEGDVAGLHLYKTDDLFLSTPSARRATKEIYAQGKDADISIHALREEGDKILPWPKSTGTRFLSTPSARRATIAG